MEQEETIGTYSITTCGKNFLEPNIPKFFYFDDYRLLPGKINLNELKAQYDASQKNPQALSDGYKTVISLMNVAGIDLNSLINPKGYEIAKARLEGIAIKVTDKVFEYWTQNQELDVEFDIRTDPQDKPPFNNGSNLYIRIRNRRHRVSVPFEQRSKGFIWFFSFIIWFDSIKKTVKYK